MRAASRIIVGLLALLLLPAASMGARPALRPDDMTLGNARAGVVLVEYASLSCPHCANFHNKVFPAFKAKYVDTGKVLFVYREYVTNPPQLAVPTAALARCSGKANYFRMIERIFAVQDQIYAGGTVQNMRTILKREAKALGMSDEAFEACMSDQAGFDAVLARAARAAEEDGVHGTPTFVVNGKTVDWPVGGEMDLATLDKAIAAAK